MIETIDGIRTSFAEAQHLSNLLLCLACGTIVHHAQDLCDAQWRQQQVLLLASRAEQIQGEVVVALHQCALLLAQLNPFGSPEVGIRKKERIALYMFKFFIITDTVWFRFEQIMHQPIAFEANTLYSNIAQHVLAAVGTCVTIAVAAEVLNAKGIHFDSLLYGLCLLNPKIFFLELQRQV